MKKFLAVLLLFCSFGFGQDGHEALGAIANVSDENVQDKNDGSENFGNRVSGTINDFSSMLSGFLEASPTDDGKAANVKFNLPKTIFMGDFQLSAIVHEPDVFDALENEIPDDDRAGQILLLKEGLEDFDKVNYCLSWNLQSKGWGRALKDEHGTLIEKFLFHGTTADKVVDCKTLEDKCKADAKKNNITFDESVRKELQEKYKDEFKVLNNLASNQPQFIITGEYAHRNQITGRSALHAKLTLETGLRNNLNFLRKQVAQNPDQTAKEVYSSLLSKKAIEKGARVAFKAEYTRTDAWSNQFYLDMTESEDSETPQVLKMEATTSFKAEFSLGWNILTSENTAKGRFELTASYIDPESSAMEQSRFLASLSYTAASANGAAVPITLLYSNRTEFLGETDHKFSAYFGIKFKGG